MCSDKGYKEREREREREKERNGGWNGVSLLCSIRWQLQSFGKGPDGIRESILTLGMKITILLKNSN